MHFTASGVYLPHLVPTNCTHIDQPFCLQPAVLDADGVSVTEKRVFYFLVRVLLWFAASAPCNYMLKWREM